MKKEGFAGIDELIPQLAQVRTEFIAKHGEAKVEPSSAKATEDREVKEEAAPETEAEEGVTEEAAKPAEPEEKEGATKEGEPQAAAATAVA